MEEEQICFEKCDVALSNKTWTFRQNMVSIISAFRRLVAEMRAALANGRR